MNMQSQRNIVDDSLFNDKQCTDRIFENDGIHNFHFRQFPHFVFSESRTQ